MNPWLAFLLGLWIGGFLGICAVALVQSSKDADDWGERLSEFEGGVMDPDFYDQELEGARKIAPTVIVRRK